MTQKLDTQGGHYVH